jgi:hypothetical protein
VLGELVFGRLTICSDGRERCIRVCILGKSGATGDESGGSGGDGAWIRRLWRGLRVTGDQHVRSRWSRRAADGTGL